MEMKDPPLPSRLGVPVDLCAPGAGLHPSSFHIDGFPDKVSSSFFFPFSLVV